MYKTLDNILSQLEDNKALDIVSIDLKGKSDIADFLVIATGTSNRHVGSLSENLITELKKDGIKNIKAEGINKSDWVLIDSGDVIVHPFMNYRVVKRNDTWFVEHEFNDSGQWKINQTFKDKEVPYSFFDNMHELHYTVEDYGPFLRGLRANRWWKYGGIILRDNLVNDLESETITQWTVMTSYFMIIFLIIGAVLRITQKWKVMAKLESNIQMNILL